ncbi:hypothetical protein HK098_005612 [Nowakowskiella sp. JEL0407]|nr:hypothetical protein HK098_005612 [Nowakowskiella sp. JEL0407]
MLPWTNYDKDNGLLSAYFSKVEDDPMSQENSLTTPVPAQSNFENMDPKISNLGSENEAIEIKIKKIKSDIRDLKNRLNLQ